MRVNQARHQKLAIFQEDDLSVVKTIFALTYLFDRSIEASKEGDGAICAYSKSALVKDLKLSERLAVNYASNIELMMSGQ